MRCVNCGQEYVGNFCDMCGTPAVPSAMPEQVMQQQQVQQPVMNQVQQPVVNSTDVGTLCIQRPKGFAGCLIDIELTVDGYPYRLSSGGQLIFSLTPGPHIVTYKVWCRSLQTVNLFVQPRGNYLIDFQYDWLWGGFKLSKNCILQ